MDMNIRSLLEAIGDQMDANVFPSVLNGGLVKPSRQSASIQILGEEFYNESESTEEPWASASPGNQAGAWASTAGSSAAGRTWAAREASPFSLGPKDNDLYPGLNEVGTAYPGTLIYRQEEGFWLRLDSRLLPRIGRKACFVVAVIPKLRHVTAWGFWDGGFLGATWIGPRHTNYPDGSICAFDTADGDWQYGDSLVTLFDLYTIWALRHLYLEYFGRWPGPQASTSSIERVAEFKNDEWCGCSRPRGTYGNCCRQRDLAGVTLGEVLAFGVFREERDRHPPSDITAFAQSMIDPPTLRLRVSETPSRDDQATTQQQMTRFQDGGTSPT